MLKNKTAWAHPGTHFSLQIHVKQFFVWIFVLALSCRGAHFAMRNQGFKCWRIKQLGLILVHFIIHPLVAQHPKKKKTTLLTFGTNLKEKQQKAKCIPTQWKHSNPATWGWCVAIFFFFRKGIKLMLQNLQQATQTNVRDWGSALVFCC